MSEVFAFVDTSIFLQYRTFDEVDWLTTLGLKGVTLVLAPVVISELSEKKDEPSPRLRQRAAVVIRKLEALWSKGTPAEVRPGVALVRQDVEPPPDCAAHQ